MLSIAPASEPVLLAVTNRHWLGAVTPVGGLSLLTGWLALLLEKRPSQ